MDANRKSSGVQLENYRIVVNLYYCNGCVVSRFSMFYLQTSEPEIWLFGALRLAI